VNSKVLELLVLLIPNRISLAIVLDLGPLFLDDLTPPMIMIDAVLLVVIVLAVMPIVIEARLAVVITMMTVVVTAVLHHPDPVVQLMIIRHPVAVASMILIVVTTHRLIRTSMATVDHPMTVLLPAIIHHEMPDMLMTATVVAATDFNDNGVGYEMFLY